MITYFVYALVLVTAGLAVYALRRPGIAAALMWSTFATEQLFQSHIPLFIERNWLLNVAFGLIALVVFLFGNRGDEPLFRLNPTSIKIAVFLLFAFASCAWAADPNDSFSRMIDVIPYFAVIGFAGPHCIRRPSDLRDAILTTVIFGGLVMLGICFSDYSGLGLAIRGGRDQVLQANYLAAGSYAMTVGILSLGVLSVDKRQVMKVIAAISTGFAMFALYRSGARGQGIAFVVAGLIVYVGMHAWVLKKPMSRTLVFIVAAAVITLVLASQFSTDLVSHQRRWQVSELMTSTSQSSGLMGRIEMARLYLIHFFSNPEWYILGLGSSTSFKILGTYPHNVPVEVLCELGFVGFGLYLSILFGLYRGSRNVILNDNAPMGLRMMQMMLVSILIAQLILQLKQGAVTGMPLFVGIAITIALTAQQGSSLIMANRKRRTRRKASVSTASLSPATN